MKTQNQIEISGKVFMQMAGFPEPWREADLQKYIANKLVSRGDRVVLEAPCSNGRGRVDILTPNQIIEVKKYLTRDALYQAKGQIEMYARSHRNRKLVLMGFLPQEPELRKSALNTANYIRESGVNVIFLNTDPRWFPVPVKKGRKLLDYLPKLVLFRGWGLTDYFSVFAIAFSLYILWETFK